MISTNNHFKFYSTSMICNLGQNWGFQPCPCKSSMNIHWPTFNLSQFNHLIAFNICVNLFQFNYLIAFNIWVQFAHDVCFKAFQLSSLKCYIKTNEV